MRSKPSALGDLVAPSSITGAWWFGTARRTLFYRVEIRELAPGTPSHPVRRVVVRTTMRAGGRRLLRSLVRAPSPLVALTREPIAHAEPELCTPERDCHRPRCRLRPHRATTGPSMRLHAAPANRDSRNVQRHDDDGTAPRGAEHAHHTSPRPAAAGSQSSGGWASEVAPPPGDMPRPTSCLSDHGLKFSPT